MLDLSCKDLRSQADTTMLKTQSFCRMISETSKVLECSVPELWHTGLVEHGRIFLQDDDKSFIGLCDQVSLQNPG